MTTINVNSITNVAGTGAPNAPDSIAINSTALASASTYHYYAQSTAPTGTSGDVWWNTSASKLYMYANSKWSEIKVGGETPAPTYAWGGNRGLWGGGISGSTLGNIDYVTIATTGNATSFGTLSASRGQLSACSNSARGVFGGGNVSSSVIDYVTVATTGNATSFGTLTTGRYYLASCSNGTRGLFAGGTNTGGTRIADIEQITIATTGNATSFGNLTSARHNMGSCSNDTRGLFAGGFTGSPSFVRVVTIDFVTIATAGNATSFGNISTATDRLTGCSDFTRGLFAGGYDGASPVNTIGYVTIATAGNATSFGSLATSRNDLAACSNGTRGVFGGGANGVGGATYNNIDYVTIATTGNATSFGTLTLARGELASCSGT